MLRVWGFNIKVYKVWVLRVFFRVLGLLGLRVFRVWGLRFGCLGFRALGFGV